MIDLLLKPVYKLGDWLVKDTTILTLCISAILLICIGGVIHDLVQENTGLFIMVGGFALVIVFVAAIIIRGRIGKGNKL